MYVCKNVPAEFETILNFKVDIMMEIVIFSPAAAVSLKQNLRVVLRAGDIPDLSFLLMH